MARDIINVVRQQLLQFPRLLHFAIPQAVHYVLEYLREHVESCGDRGIKPEDTGTCQYLTNI
jgi:hypothetical protein